MLCFALSCLVNLFFYFLDFSKNRHFIPTSSQKKNNSAMTLQFISVLLVICFLSVAFSLSEKLSSNTTCVCTTVPCPVSGNNYLTVGKYCTSTLCISKD